LAEYIRGADSECGEIFAHDIGGWISGPCEDIPRESVSAMGRLIRHCKRWMIVRHYGSSPHWSGEKRDPGSLSRMWSARRCGHWQTRSTPPTSLIAAVRVAVRKINDRTCAAILGDHVSARSGKRDGRLMRQWNTESRKEPMRIGSILAALLCAAGVTVSACSVFSTPPTARSLAKKIGCTGFQPQQDPTGYFHDLGSCYLNRSKLIVITFNSNHARDQYLQVIVPGAGNTRPWVTGDSWAVQSTDSAVESAVQKAIGGDIR